MQGPIQTSMDEKLREGLKPVSVLEIRNDSASHAGHSGNPTGAPDAETHFQVRVVSSAFEGMRLVARHRRVYEILDAEMKGDASKGLLAVHALSLNTKTPKEAGME